MKVSDVILLVSLLMVCTIFTGFIILVYYYRKMYDSSETKPKLSDFLHELKSRICSWIKKTGIKAWHSTAGVITDRWYIRIVIVVALAVGRIAALTPRGGMLGGLILAIIIALALEAVLTVLTMVITFVGFAVYDDVLEEVFSKDIRLPLDSLEIGFIFYLLMIAIVVLGYPEVIYKVYVKLICWGNSFPLVIFWLHRLLEMCRNTEKYISTNRKKIPAAIYLFCITYIVLTLYVFSHVPFGVYGNNLLEFPFDTLADWINAFLRAGYYVLMTVTMAGDDGVTPIGAWGKFDHAVIVLSGVFFLTVVASMFIGSGEEEKQVRKAGKNSKKKGEKTSKSEL